MRAFTKVMPEDEFWAVIDTMAGQVDDASVQRLTEQLRSRGPRATRGFHERLAQVLFDLDREVLAGQPVRFLDEPPGSEAIPLSDDAFLYLRAAVVALGRQTCRAVLADPSVLASRAWPECEALLSAAPNAVGADLGTRVSYETASNMAHWPSLTDGTQRPPEGWEAPVVWIEGHDLDAGFESQPYDENGPVGEPETIYSWPDYLDPTASFAPADALNEVVVQAGGLPTELGAPRLECRLGFAADEFPSSVEPRFDPDLGGEVLVSTVWVSHTSARSWKAAEAGMHITAHAALAALAALPDDHPARPQLTELAECP